MLVLIVPATALADVTGTKTLSQSQILSLDTGAVVASGGDLQWTGSQIRFVGTAKGLDLSSSLPFNNVTQTILATAAMGFSTASITPSAKDVIAVKTNGGNYAKALVTAINATSITLQYVTFGASSTPSGPAVNAVINNYSGILPGLPNYGIAPGSIFVIYGTGMSDNVPLQLQSSVGGLPTTLNHASISVTVGGKTVTPAIYYAIPTQIAAVLPSTTPTGTGTITVTYNGQTSNAAQMVVAASAFGMGTLNQAGTGGIIATDYPNYNLITPTHSAAPGQVLILWGSGLGADTNNDDKTFPNQQDNLNNATVYIGGQQANVAYAGRSQFPGVDQINLTVPQGVSGCGVSVAVVVGKTVSNFGTLPINSGNGVCQDPLYGIDGTQLTQGGGSQGAIRTGFVGLLQATSPSLNSSIVRTRLGRPRAQTFSTTYSADAGFSSVTPGSASITSDILSLGSCLVTFDKGSGTGTGGLSNGLDAGSPITLAGGGISVQLTSLPTFVGTYFAQLMNPLIGGSAYTFTGPGGKDVGPFNATVNFPNPLTWTNESSISAVTEASGQLITWSGGATGTYVYISGGSSSTDGSVSAGFTCYAPASDQQFTVPSYVLLSLPTGNGDLGVYNATIPVPFTASGLDYGFGSAVVYSSENVTYQ